MKKILVSLLAFAWILFALPAFAAINGSLDAGGFTGQTFVWDYSFYVNNAASATTNDPEHITWNGLKATISYDTAGDKTVQFTFKNAAGAVTGQGSGRIRIVNEEKWTKKPVVDWNPQFVYTDFRNGSVDWAGVKKAAQALYINTLGVMHGVTQDFIAKAGEAGLNLWALVYPVGNSGKAQKPYGEDYEKWAEYFANLSLTYKNLQAFQIDDTHPENNANKAKFTPAYIVRVNQAKNRVNPNFKFLPVLYFDSSLGVDSSGSYYNEVRFYRDGNPFKNAFPDGASFWYVSSIYDGVDGSGRDLRTNPSTLKTYLNEAALTVHPTKYYTGFYPVATGAFGAYFRFYDKNLLKSMADVAVNGADGVNVFALPLWAYDLNTTINKGSISKQLANNDPAFNYRLGAEANKGTATGWQQALVKNINVSGAVASASISFSMKDGRDVGTTKGYHFKQLLVDDNVVWEKDVSDDGVTAEVVSKNLKTYLTAGNHTIKIRLFDKLAVSNFPIDVYVGQINLKINGVAQSNVWTFKGGMDETYAAGYRGMFDTVAASFANVGDFQPSLIGFFDGASCGGLSGWACDNYFTADPIKVEIYADGARGTGTLVATADANLTREMAVANLCGGYRNRGFKIDVPANLKDGKSHTYYAYALSGSARFLLGTNAKQITCTAACANDCTSGAKQCANGKVQTCGNYDSDSCTEWGGDTACASGKTCINGTCSNPLNPANINTYVVPVITDNKILPDSLISSSYVSANISLSAAKGEYEPASFVIKSSAAISSLTVEPTSLTGGSGTIPAANVDIKAVKVWWQSGMNVHDLQDYPTGNPTKQLSPELLLKNDSMIRVDATDNYLKLSNGKEVKISDPNGIFIDSQKVPAQPTIAQFSVKDSNVLLPVNLPANYNKQIWVTVRIPDNLASGQYSGKILLKNSGTLLKELNLTVNVLPIKLPEPKLEYSIYYIGKLGGGTISHYSKTEEQYRAELKDMLAHGVNNPQVYPVGDIDRALALRNEVGMNNKRIYFAGGFGNSTAASIKSRALDLKAKAVNAGADEFYIYGRDEQNMNTPEDRARIQAVHEAGGKVYNAVGYDGGDQVTPVADVLDLAVIHHAPRQDFATLYHNNGHRVASYSNPQCGIEKPETYRRNFGLLLWQKDYDGAMDYAYQMNANSIWNDFDTLNETDYYKRWRDHVFAYPTVDGVVDTIEWEGFREGVDDVRYLTELLNRAAFAKSKGTNVAAIESWINNLKNSNLTGRDLNSVRSQIIDKIMTLPDDVSVCIPNAVSGCKVCNTSGSAWVDTNSKCATGQTCSSGVCVAGCSNDCASGAKQCANGKVQTCGNYDADSCTEWGNAVACASNQTCFNGQCVNNCTSHTSKKCDSGNLYWHNSCNVKEELFQSCGVTMVTNNYKCNTTWTQRETVQKGCTNNACTSVSVWNNVENCAAGGKTCTNGICVTSQTCVPNAVSGCKVCNAQGTAWVDTDSKCASGKKCQNGTCITPYHCTPGTYDGCAKCITDGSAWLDDNTKCTAGKKCSFGSCVDINPCTNECTTNTKRCTNNKVQTCGNYDTDSCTEWGGDTACAANQTCNNGICVTNCVPKTCSALGNYECGSWPNGCGSTINCGACASGKTCSNGKCIANCTSHSAKKCDSGNLYWYNSCNTKEELFQNCGTTAPTNNYKCNGTWVQRETVQKGCANNVCTAASAWSNTENCAASNKICINGACKVCTPNAVFGCKVCNAQGTAWVDTDSRCAANQICGNGVCALPCADWVLAKNLGGVIKYDPAVAVSNNRLIITGIGANSSAYAAEYAAAGTLINWYGLSGLLTSRTQMDTEGGIVNLKAIGTDGHVWKRTFTASKTWTNWEQTSALALNNPGPDRAIMNGMIYLAKRKSDGSTILGTCGSAQICTSNTVSGCKVCNASGSAWVDTNSKCATGQTCSSGVCVAGCSNDCTSGAKQCANGKVQTCGNYDSDYCTEWGGDTACVANKKCFIGYCFTSGNNEIFRSELLDYINQLKQQLSNLHKNN